MALAQGPITRRKLSDEVFERLKTMITSGELRPGDSMPAERDLRELFQVGRPAVREAMQALSNVGLLTITHGERAKVRQPTARSLFQQLDLAAQVMLASSRDSLEHLKAARRFFELGMVSDAAERADAGRYRQAGGDAGPQRQCLGEADAFIHADMSLHTQIAGDLRQPDLRGCQRGDARLAEGIPHRDADLDGPRAVHAGRA